jgi:hypothetical protein
MGNMRLAETEISAQVNEHNAKKRRVRRRRAKRMSRSLALACHSPRSLIVSHRGATFRLALRRRLVLEEDPRGKIVLRTVRGLPHRPRERAEHDPPSVSALRDPRATFALRALDQLRRRLRAARRVGPGGFAV